MEKENGNPSSRKSWYFTQLDPTDVFNTQLCEYPDKVVVNLSEYFPVRKVVFVSDRGNCRILLSAEDSEVYNHAVNALFFPDDFSLKGRVVMISNRSYNPSTLTPAISKT